MPVVAEKVGILIREFDKCDANFAAAFSLSEQNMWYVTFRYEADIMFEILWINNFIRL